MRNGAILLIGLTVGCGPRPTPSPASIQSIELPGLHNLFRVSESVYSGSGPDGDEAFDGLRRLGVRTIISVDGAKPDAATAKRYGMRYVHIPIGYDGVPRDKVLALVKAVRELPGPVYVHCHHGQHRGPAAVAVIQLCNDDTWTRDRAEEWLRLAGTDPRYTGLTEIPRQLIPPTAEELAVQPSDFVEAAAIPDLARLMVGIDVRWDRLKLAKSAGWKVPKDHPDIDPPHEALQIVELYREAARLGDNSRRGAEFGRHVSEGESSATELEKALRTAADTERVNAAFALSSVACQTCHTRYRDRPAGH